MDIPPSNLVYLVERAAELRAAGNSWEQTAQKLGRCADTIRNWPRRYRAFWDQAIAIARRNTAADAGDEGLAILRTLLRSDDDKVRREASVRLLDLRPDAGDTPAASNELVRFVEFLEGLSDAELDSLLGPDIGVDCAGTTSDPADAPGPAITA
jgi:hypothetical protein